MCVARPAWHCHCSPHPQLLYQVYRRLRQNQNAFNPYSCGTLSIKSTIFFEVFDPFKALQLSQKQVELALTTVS